MEALKKRKPQVLYLLKNYPDTRNNDCKLEWRWFTLFAHVKLPKLTPKQFNRFSGIPEGLPRVRRIIQNKEGLFKSSKKVRKERQKKQAEIETAIHEA